MNEPKNVIFLGAGKPAYGEVLPALQLVNSDTRIIDWLLRAYANINVTNFTFVVGYDYQEVLGQYPNITFQLNSEWEQQGSLGSLIAVALPTTKPTYVSYTDILYRPSVIEDMDALDGDVIIAIDSNWQNRYDGRSDEDIAKAEKIVKDPNGFVISSSPSLSMSEANAEFSGIIKLSPKSIAYFKDSLLGDISSLKKESLPFLVQKMIDVGLSVKWVDVNNNYAELNTPLDICQFILGTKAETLSRLRPMVEQSIVGDQISFSVEDWLSSPDKVINTIHEKFPDGALVVRSSAFTEDGWACSNAGSFESLLNIPSNDPVVISQAIDTVIHSYGDDDVHHQVLVQKMLENVAMSGVVFTRELATGAPYYTFNYDSQSGSTESVTSGNSLGLETITIARDCGVKLEKIVPELSPVMLAIQEVESLLSHDALDIEFAVTHSGDVYIFQVRPIAVDHSETTISDDDVHWALDRAGKLFEDLQAPSPHIVGKRAIFGVMPDWNPAEIIGTRPMPLAASLYRYLIMDSTWAKQRGNFGYRNALPSPLLVMFAGHPYVDIRASFNSFIPKALDDTLAEKLVDHAIDRLEANPELHDKIEFDILITCLDFNYANKSKELIPENKFSDTERESLRLALLNITKGGFQRIDEDLEVIEVLKQRFEDCLTSAAPPSVKCDILLDDCLTYGTLPFAHLARHGFIAVTLLRSLEARGIATRKEIDDFLNNVPSITGEFEADGGKVFDNKISWVNFVEKYGHLRPGTYDIKSPRYDSDPEVYLRPMVKPNKIHESERKTASIQCGEKANKIEEALHEMGLEISAKEFFEYCNKAIAGREIAKFYFTRNLSLALEHIISILKEMGFSVKEAAFLNIEDILQIRKLSTLFDPKKIIENKISIAKREFAATSCVQLPSLLLKRDDFYVFSQIKSLPNYITTKSIISEVAVLNRNESDPSSIRGKIVMIESADPGFDWIFGYDVKGLITMYGGANSHMAIRAAELGLPSIIGAGQSLYQSLSEQRLLELDCLNKTVRVI